ncbi:MAG: AAA family ATPase [Motilibacteraceae bacterium]
MSRRYITTGPPGSGKSTSLALLSGDAELVREAASDVVAAMLREGIERPELAEAFLPRIVALQRERRLAAGSELQIHDRSIFCTLALARLLKLPEPRVLRDEIEDCVGWYQSEVFYCEPLESITHTAVRRITYADAIRFGEIHRAVYGEHGFELIDVSPGPATSRAAAILHRIRSSMP